MTHKHRNMIKLHSTVRNKSTSFFRVNKSTSFYGTALRVVG